MADTLPTTHSGPGLGAILDLLWRRRIVSLPWHEHCREMSDHYNDRIVIPMPEMDEDERPAVANLIAQRLDQHSMRVASRSPSRFVPPLAATKAGEKTARRQELVLARYDDVNEMEIFDGRRARWLATWSSAPVFIQPNPITRQPEWVLRNPLGTYPAPTYRYDDMRPVDCIFTYIQTYGWLRKNHPQVASALQAGVRRKYTPDDRFEMVEYVNDEVSVLGCIGTGPAPDLSLVSAMGVTALPLPSNAKGQTYGVELQRVPNLAGTCTAVVPGRVSLDAPRGLADGMLGIFQMEAKLYALYANAVARGIYPDTWFVEQQGGQGEIITMADGLTGTVGHVRGGTIQELGKGASQQSFGLINSLDENLRVTGSMPSEWSGMSQTNVRTAQRGLDIASSAVSYYIQEDQRVIARAKRHEYEIAAAVDRGYFKNESKTFYVDFGKERGHVDYKPGELWQTIPEIKVRYFYPGMDAAGLTTLLGQKLGEGTISRETAMRHDPAITDPQMEYGRMVADRLDDAILAATQQQANSGQIQLTDIVRIKQLMKSGDLGLEDAILQAQQEAQARQASTTGTVQPGAPEAQVGLQAGPQGQQQPTTIAPPNPSQVNLSALLRTLSRGQKVVA